MSERYSGAGATSLSLATTGTGAAIATNGAKRIVVTTLWSTLTTAGAVVYEGAHSSSYTGAWQELAVHSLGTDKVVIESYEKSFQVTRARVTDTVVGGTVTCSIQAIDENNG